MTSTAGLGPVACGQCISTATMCWRQATELVEAQEFAVMATELTGVSDRERDRFCHASAADCCLRSQSGSLLLGPLLLRACSDCCSAVGGGARQGLGGGTSGGGVAS